MSNLIPFCFLDEAKIEDISKLAVVDLLSLQARLSSLLAEAKRHKNILDNALELKFSEQAKAALQADGRDTGTAHFIEDNYAIIADLPKKVVWDQNKLSEIIDKIPAEDRKQYIKTNYSIDERKYVAWPENIKQFFSDARTVQIGKTSLLNTLEQPTLCIDMEAGLLAVQKWSGDSINVRTWEEARDIACLIGGPNPALRAEQAYSNQHYAQVCKKYGDPKSLSHYSCIFIVA